MKVRAYNILWDTDGDESVKLPHETTIDIDLESDVFMETADYLSDVYGYGVIAIGDVKIVN